MRTRTHAKRQPVRDNLGTIYCHREFAGPPRPQSPLRRHRKLIEAGAGLYKITNADEA